jgi:hypothetical protein
MQSEVTMTVKIALSPEAEARLRDHASAAGIDVETFARKALERHLAIAPHKLPADVDDPYGALKLTNQEWIARLNAWAANHKPLVHFVDDSRESIYEDRG